MTLGRVKIGAGALVALALLFYLDRSGVTAMVLAACFLHELGHWGAIHALGGQVAALRLTWAGAELRLSSAHRLTPGRMALAALAGPAVNLLLALGGVFLARQGAGGRFYLFAGLNLGLGCFNLLPAGWLDGGRILEALLAAAGREDLGRRVTSLCSALVAALLLLAGGFLLWESDGRNFTVLAAGIWMAAAARSEWREVRQ